MTAREEQADPCKHRAGTSGLQGAGKLPLTVSVADSEALSTTVWAVHVYRPECFSWVLRMVRSPTASFCVGKRRHGGESV